MARIDRIARWVAGDVLKARGVEKTPQAMSALMPVSYVIAEGVMRALAEFTAEMADELAGATAVIRVPVSAGGPFVDAFFAEWEAELARDDQESD